MAVQITIEVPLMVELGGDFPFLEADEVREALPDIGGKCLVMRTHDTPEESIELCLPGAKYKLLVDRFELRRALDLIDKATAEPEEKAA